MSIHEAFVAANRSICLLWSPGAACRHRQAVGGACERLNAPVNSAHSLKLYFISWWNHAWN